MTGPEIARKWRKIEDEYDENTHNLKKLSGMLFDYVCKERKEKPTDVSIKDYNNTFIWMYDKLAKIKRLELFTI